CNFFAAGRIIWHATCYLGRRMRYCVYRRFVFLTLGALVFAWSVPGAAASDSGSEQADRKQQQDQKQKQKQSQAKDGGASLTGCIDEQDGHYVMVNDRTLDPIADLQAEGFET